MRLVKHPVARVPIPERLEIELTEQEEAICDILNQCKTYLQEEKDIITSCRIAGGWVRDKLLGSQSNDIDVALSDMMGLSFAEYLVAFAQEKGIEIGTITKIEQNPEQSKHLETATFKVYDHSIDLVNLRSEAYAENSRIPTEVSFGTPTQDALRRDITINALFYNIHTRAVEDFTEKGLSDLRKGIIRTPLPPRETFLDDPLRILRCVRFASRFGFDIVPEIKEAVLDPQIKKALVSKVTRERVGTEVEKTMQGANPFLAVELILELKLYDAVFAFPVDEKYEVTLPNEEGQGTSFAAASILHALLSSEGASQLTPVHPILSSKVKGKKEDQSRFYLATMLLPYLGQTYQDHKGKTQPVVELMIRESLKRGTQSHYLDGIPLLFSSVPLIQQTLVDNLNKSLSRLQLGLFLRDRSIHNPNAGAHWSSSLLWALVNELVGTYDTAKDVIDVDRAGEIIAKYNSFVETVVEFVLQDSADDRPLLTGSDVITALKQPKAGPWVGKVLEDVIKWQLQHPGRSKEQCLEWLEEQDPSVYLSGQVEQQASKRPKTR